MFDMKLSKKKLKGSHEDLGMHTYSKIYVVFAIIS